MAAIIGTWCWMSSESPEWSEINDRRSLIEDVGPPCGIFKML